MTDTPEAFEVQALIMHGDRGGQWDEVGAASLPRDEAEALALELRESGGEPIRVVPFGTGPNGRAGDVSPGGAIITDDPDVQPYSDGIRYRQAGKVSVTPEQADNAELFGWRRTGQIEGTVSAGDLMVEVSL